MGVPKRALWIALSLTDHVGSKTLKALFEHFDDDPDSILAADATALQRVPGIGPKIARSIQAVDVARIETALAAWADTAIATATSICSDSTYPQRLLEIS